MGKLCRIRPGKIWEKRIPPYRFIFVMNLGTKAEGGHGGWRYADAILARARDHRSLGRCIGHHLGFDQPDCGVGLAPPARIDRIDSVDGISRSANRPAAEPPAKRLCLMREIMAKVTWIILIFALPSHRGDWRNQAMKQPAKYMDIDTLAIVISTAVILVVVWFVAF
jgi:hypothetical protein